ncbi:MAG: putative toxin-antitoxin system toxin component, PIN family [Thermomicrobiales bacterium]
MRVVADTNMIISALLIPDSVAADILRLWRSGSFDLVVSEPLLAEFHGVALRPHIRIRHGLSDEGLNEFFAVIRRHSIVVVPRQSIRVVTADPDDNKIIECAVAGQADVIVTGDKKHLLPLGSYEGIPIVSPAALLTMFDRV